MGPTSSHQPRSASGSRNLTGKYAEVAAAMGGYSRRVDRPDDVVPSLQEAIRVVEDGTPALLEFITSREPPSPSGSARGV